MMRLIMTAALAAFASAQCDLTPGTDCSSDTCTYTALVGTAATSDSCDSSTTTTVTTCTGTSTPTIVDETCLDTVEGEVVADCATGYTAGTVDAPSTTCPTGCTQVDATSSPATCTEAATTSVQADADACAAVTGTDLDDATACGAVMTAADGAVAACTYAGATSSTETCTDTVEGEVVADCATGYTAGTVDAPSTTCPTGFTQVDATSTAGATCDLTTGSCPAGCDSADAATFVAAADASTDYVAEACTVTPVETTTTTAASTPPASGASAVTVGALTICATVAALL
jgi:hypothetical protein